MPCGQISKLSKPFSLSAAGLLIAAQIVAIVVNYISHDLQKIQARATAQCRLQFIAEHLANKIYLDFCDHREQGAYHPPRHCLDSLDISTEGSRSLFFTLPFPRAPGAIRIGRATCTATARGRPVGPRSSSMGQPCARGSNVRSRRT